MLPSLDRQRAYLKEALSLRSSHHHHHSHAASSSQRHASPAKGSLPGIRTTQAAAQQGTPQHAEAPLPLPQPQLPPGASAAVALALDELAAVARHLSVMGVPLSHVGTAMLLCFFWGGQGGAVMQCIW